MQKGPLKALLAVLAVAGYQNRDKIADMLREATGRGNAPAGTSPQDAGPGQGGQPEQDGRTGTTSDTASPSGGGLDDLLGSLQGGLGSILAGGSLGSVLNTGLGELFDQFRQSGHADKADSWVKPGSNQPIDNRELSDALGPDVLADLAARTGLSEEEILTRLSKDLPGVIDELTPDGQMPDQAGSPAGDLKEGQTGDQPGNRTPPPWQSA